MGPFYPVLSSFDLVKDTSNRENNQFIYPTQPAVLDGVSLCICDQGLVSDSANMATIPLPRPGEDHKKDNGQEEQIASS